MSLPEWIILYDDGFSPKIHMTFIKAETMSSALLEFSKRFAWPNSPFSCALNGRQGSAGAAILSTMGHGVIEVKGSDG